MTAISVDEFASDVYKYIELATISELLIECNNGKRLSIHEEPEEEFADPLTSAELEIISRGEENRKKGHYYKKLPGETTEAFLDRITSDPENQMVCNSAQWQNREYQ